MNFLRTALKQTRKLSRFVVQALSESSLLYSRSLTWFPNQFLIKINQIDIATITADEVFSKFRSVAGVGTFSEKVFTFFHFRLSQPWKQERIFMVGGGVKSISKKYPNPLFNQKNLNSCKFSLRIPSNIFPPSPNTSHASIKTSCYKRP